MDGLVIYVAAHARAAWPSDPCYVPIQAGAAINDDLGILRDDTGANISARNPYYCELTALYWIWKHARAEHVGLVHYRRLFFAKTHALAFGGQQIASGQDIAEQLRTSNLIVVRPLEFFHEGTMLPRSVEQQYVGTHHGPDLLQARTVIARLSRAYLPAFDFVMRNNKLVAFNMVIARKAILDHYCAWIFKILFALEKRIPVAAMQDRYQARALGFLAERLFTVWLTHNSHRLRIDYRPYAICSDGDPTSAPA